MSRIHEALRRGRSPASPSPAGPTANPDAVLAALGYKSGRHGGPNAGVLLWIIVSALVAGGIWWMLPSTVSSRPSAPLPTPLKQSPIPVKQAAIPKSAAPLDVRPVESNPPDEKPTETKPPTPKPEAPTPLERPTPAQSHSATKPVTVARGEPFVSRQAPREVPAATISSKPSAPVEPEPAPKTDDFRLALYYQRSGDFEQALVHYKAVLQRDEMNVTAHNNLGNLYMSKGLFDDAAREFRRVVAVEPRYVTAHVNLSAALYQLKRYDESAAEARIALRFDSRNDDAYVNLALAQAAAGQPADARANLTRALEIDKHNAAAHYNLALQYEKAGEIALALDHYRAFLQYAGPEQADYAADVRSRVRALESRREPGPPNRDL